MTLNSVILSKLIDKFFPDFTDELLLQILPVIHLWLMQIKKEKQNNCDAETFQLYIVNVLDVEIDVPMDLSEAEDHTYDF